MAQELTTEIIRLAYRLFLDREPENEQVLKTALNYGSVEVLREAFFRSTEFRDKELIEPAFTPLDSPPLEVEWQADEAETVALLSHTGRTWTQLGKDRPHWSVLSSDQFAPEKIDQNRDAFFQSGSQDRDVLLAVLRRLGLVPGSFPELFEFGCGLARVTPFLARSFPRVIACDISASHIAVAEEILRREKIENAVLRLADTQDFGMISGFDMWYSRLVLQHNPPPIIAMALERALSMLNPGGVAHFQVPTYALGYRFRVADYLAGLKAQGEAANQIEMHVLPLPAIFEIAARHSCEPLEVWHDNSTGRPTSWVSNVVTLRKRKD